MNTNNTKAEFLNAAEAASLLQQFAQSLRQAGAPADAEKFERIAAGLHDATSEELRTARLEKYKSELAGWAAEVKYHFDWRIESLKGTLALAQRAITSAMVVNGGAAIALLAYMGNTKATAVPFIVPLIWFAGGVFVGAITFTLSYFTQFYYTEDTSKGTARGKKFHYATAITLVVSYLIFVGGIMAAQSAFTTAAALPAADTAQQERRNMPPPKAPAPAPDYPAQPAKAPAEPLQIPVPESAQGVSPTNDAD